MMRVMTILAGAALIVATAVATAQTGGPATQGGTTMPSQQSSGGKERPPSPATRAYMDAAIQMQVDMAVPYSNDADRDFAQLLAAHHKGAAALATIELANGKDPEMRRLAEAVLKARESEMALIAAWKAKQP